MDTVDTQEVNAGEYGGPTMLVFDIPLQTTADEAARLLNEHCDRGFYVSSIIEWPGAGVRVFLRRYAKPAGKPEAAPSKEARALQFLRDNRELSVVALAAAFKAIGFPRSALWITKKRLEIMMVERRANL
jgi:hypothetical protein